MNEEQRKAYYDYQKSSMQYYKNKKRKKKRIILILMIIYLGLVLFVKSIGDYFYLPIQNKVDRYYDIKLNNAQFLVSVDRDEMIPIIPFVLYGNRTKRFSTIPERKDLHQIIRSEKYRLNVSAYSCISCQYKEEDVTKKRINISIKNMKIYKYKYYDKNVDYTQITDGISYLQSVLNQHHELINVENYDVIYGGKFIEDITKYISDDNLYGIQLRLKNTTLIFGLIKRDGQVIVI